MSTQQTVELARRTLETVLWIVAPLLLVATVTSLIINIFQVLTSLQDNTISSVPRLLATAVGAIVLMPWMLRKLAIFTLQMFSDFRPLLR